ELRYYVFDLLFHDGEDLRGLGTAERRQRLRALFGRKDHGPVRFSESLPGDPQQLLAAAAGAGFEGLIGKRADSPYRSGRSRDWVKLKVGQRQEFVIGGFTDPQGSRSGLGSLLLGVYDADGKLRYSGNVGTGFDTRTLDALRERLGKIESDKTPFTEGPKRVGTTRLAVPHWVRPKLVAEVAFAGWTQGGHVRQAVFQGLREDKEPRRIRREQAVHADATLKTPEPKTPEPKTLEPKKPGMKPASQPAAAALKKLPADLRVTHPERVIDASTGITKGELVAYYAQVASLMLPQLEDRPVALLRAPAGIDGEVFFQKHAEARALPHVKMLDPSLDPGNGALLAISSAAGLLSAAQMNTVELHTWNATAAAIEQPDRMIFDLDPGKGVGWDEIRDGALLMRSMLEELGLTGFLKSSGGKGLHVVVPLKPEHGWTTVKGFSQAVVQHLAKVIPQRFVAKSGPSNRVGRVFVDYLRNGRGATTAAGWSARARPGMGISVPMTWDELESMAGPPGWSVRNFEERLAIGNAPWKNYGRTRQRLAAAMRKLGYKPAE
ncbi:MAG TPA: DNA ligase D, partial [Steroidobacteraceae bacterium]|nr:DNA ligase D [Steroidobacteraceae bacterium]